MTLGRPLRFASHARDRRSPDRCRTRARGQALTVRGAFKQEGPPHLERLIRSAAVTPDAARGRALDP